MPTDTVYGLTALATNEVAVRALVDLKGRDSEQPIAVLFDRIEDIAPYLDDEALLDRVARHWPGALTAVVHARADAGFVAPVVTEERTIGIRQPDDEITRAVLRGCGGVLAVSSANQHGGAPALDAAEVASVFGEVLAVLDGGARDGGMASTVVDLTVQPPQILRAGPIGKRELGLDY
jgi:L-threonylcarbamoyladenylate synthase